MNMLQGAPWLLAHKSMLTVNQPHQVSLYGKDYVLWQDLQGNINALENVCPHMGAMLSAGWCEAKPDRTSTVVCPFHALEFDAKGCTILPGSNQQTLPQISPLELIVQGNFIWSFGTVAQCHFFVPESEHRTRTYVLLFAQPKHPLFKLMSQQFLDVVKVVVQQDADILGKIYPNAPQKIKLNNEVGMDWVRRNFKSFPAIDSPNLSK